MTNRLASQFSQQRDDATTGADALTNAWRLMNEALVPSRERTLNRRKGNEGNKEEPSWSSLPLWHSGYASQGSIERTVLLFTAFNEHMLRFGDSLWQFGAFAWFKLVRWLPPAGKHFAPASMEKCLLRTLSVNLREDEIDD